MLGSILPFAPAALAQRYCDRDDYLAQVRRAASALVAARWLLAEDVESLIAGAGRLYDAVAARLPA